MRGAHTWVASAELHAIQSCTSHVLMTITKVAPVRLSMSQHSLSMVNVAPHRRISNLIWYVTPFVTEIAPLFEFDAEVPSL